MVAKTDRLLARHWLSHPEDSAYKAAQHMGLNIRTVQKAAERLRERVGETEEKLLTFLRSHPIEHKEFSLRHPNPSTWIAAPPVRVSLSGEDAAAVEGWDLVPHRHLYYVEEGNLDAAVESLLDSGARLAEPPDANVTVRVRDPWLMDDPPPLVERGQRLVDYAESRNIQLLRGMRE